MLSHTMTLLYGIDALTRLIIKYHVVRILFMCAMMVSKVLRIHPWVMAMAGVCVVVQRQLAVYFMARESDRIWMQPSKITDYICLP